MTSETKVPRFNMCMEEEEILPIEEAITITENIANDSCTNPDDDCVTNAIKDRDADVQEKVKRALSLKLGTSSIIAFFVATFKDQIIELLEFLISIISSC